MGNIGLGELVVIAAPVKRGDMDDDERAVQTIAQVDEIYRDGPPPRTTVPVIIDGVTRFFVNGLFLECTACSTRIPQSRTRQSPPARALWLRFHLKCVAQGS